MFVAYGLCAYEAVRPLLDDNNGPEWFVAGVACEAGGMEELRGVLDHVPAQRRPARGAQWGVDSAAFAGRRASLAAASYRLRGCGRQCRRGCRGALAKRIVAAERARLKDIVHAHKVGHD